MLAVSQFTLTASTNKGNRPSYIRAAGHVLAIPLYEKYCEEVSVAIGKPVGRGVFGADMKVSLLNDGPVTIIALESGVLIQRLPKYSESWNLAFKLASLFRLSRSPRWKE